VEVYWTYSYNPVRDEDGKVCGTLVVCTETTDQVLTERRLRTLLGITVKSLAQEQLPEMPSLARFAQTIVAELSGAPEDIPFATLYLFRENEPGRKHNRNRGTGGSAPLPVGRCGQFANPTLLEDLHRCLGDGILKPWPEPVTRAYVLPLRLPGLSIFATVVYGISPRIPFDHRYEAFFQLVGARIAGLLQIEIHQLELARAAKRFSGLVEADPFGMVIGDLEGQVKYINPAFLETLGYSHAEVSAGRVRWDKLTPPEYAEADARAVQQLRVSGRCDVYEKVYIAKNKRRIPIHRRFDYFLRGRASRCRRFCHRSQRTQTGGGSSANRKRRTGKKDNRSYRSLGSPNCRSRAGGIQPARTYGTFVSHPG
jgi:PAS domain S-box-containing protein